MSTVYIMVGVPGSGKSTLARKIADEVHAEIIATDAIRQELLGDANSQEDGDLVFSTFFDRAKDAVREGRDVILDATHVSVKSRARIFRNLEGLEYRSIAVVKYVKAGVVKSRNRNRDRVVPNNVVNRFYRNFEMPTKNEGFEEILINRE